MRQVVFPVFDEYIAGTSTWYTSAAFNDALGMADDIGVQVVTEQVSGGTGPVTITPEHSCNGLDWLQFNVGVSLSAGPIFNDSSYYAESGFFGAGVMLSYVRLRITMTGAATCRLKVFVVTRVSSASARASAVANAQDIAANGYRSDAGTRDVLASRPTAAGAIDGAAARQEQTRQQALRGMMRR